MPQNRWNRTWRIVLATPQLDKSILLDKTMPGELVLDVATTPSLPGFANTKAYRCTSVTNMSAHWQGCYFIKYGSKSLQAPAGIAEQPPYTAYGVNPVTATLEHDHIATAAPTNITTSTLRLLAAAVTQDNDPRTVFLALYQIPNAVTPDPNSPTNSDKPFLLCKYWDPKEDGTGNPGGGGSGYGSRP